MDINKRLIDLFKKLDNSELANKAELKAEAKCCVDAMMHYFSVVSDEQLHCLEKTNINLTSIMMLEKKRSEAHDDAINACSRINDICHEVKLDEVFDFDTTDRRKVAAACGLLAGELYFSNLDNETTLKDYVTFADRNLYDTECFAWVLARNVAERLSCYSYIENFEPVYASLKDKTVELEYSDSKGKRVSVCDEIDVSRLYEPGYLNKLVDRFFWDIVTTYLAKEVKENEQIPGPPETQEKMKKLLQVFNAEFSHWSKYRLEELEGNSNRLIQEICQLMCDEFYTRTWALTDLIVPIDQNELEEKLKTWSDEYQFSYEERDPDRYQKSWCLSKEGVSSTLDVNLTDEGSVFVVQVKQIDKNTSRHCLSDAYTIDVVESEIRRWLNNKV